MFDNLVVKQIIAIVSFIASIVVGFIALFIPPAGIIDPSVLWWVAQLLVFTSGLLGINLTIDHKNKIATTKKEDVANDS